MKRRGLSQIITTLIIILLIFIAVGIVWGVVRGVLQGGADDIESFDSLLIELEIQQVTEDQSTIDVAVYRDAGVGEMEGLRFYISNGETTVTRDWTGDLNQLEQITATLDYSGIIREISVAPTITNSKGEVMVGELKDTLDLSSNMCNIPQGAFCQAFGCSTGTLPVTDEEGLCGGSSCCAPDPTHCSNNGGTCRYEAEGCEPGESENPSFTCSSTNQLCCI